MLSVKILSDEEFDVLPYPEARISMGVADTKIGQAFVRYTASEELNKYLIEHELEHLLGEDRDEIHHGGGGMGPQMAIPSGGPSMLPSMPNAGRMSPQISPIKLANPMNFMGSQKPT